MSLAISVQNVSKLYRLGEISRGQLIADLHRWWTRRTARNLTWRDRTELPEPEEKGDFWALKDISFELEQGETIAIIGANGAGKSTLLKIISRITAPTSGLVRIRGRIGTLLEVGTGFHPELTGRDNVFLNGAILGMNRNEVKIKFDDIVGFSGLEQFIDTPVKRYSSGMYVRLAFSVAAFLEPEILIIDEVLSVGDQQFQNQCIRRMEEIIKDGRTLIFVSHGAGLVQQVCRRAVLLQRGEIIFDGDVDDAFAAYEESTRHEAPDQNQQAPSEHAPSNNALSSATPTTDSPSEAPPGDTPFAEPSASDAPLDDAAPSELASNEAPPSDDALSNQTISFKEWPDLSTAPGDDVVKLQAIRVVDAGGFPIENLLTTQTAIVEVEFVVLTGGRFLQPGLIFSNGLGNALFWTVDTNPMLRRRAMENGRYKASMAIPADFLAPGTIFIDVGLGQIVGGLETHVFESKIVSFNVVDDFAEYSVRCGYPGPLPGFVRPRMKWITNRQSTECEPVDPS